ncbi:MAG: DUF4340 domain-containing protein [Elusimicrobiota bacterium]
MSPLFLKRLSLALGVLAALWAFLLWREHRASPVALLAADASSASKIVLAKPGLPPLSLSKGQGGWELLEPFRFPAGTTAVEGFLDKLSKLRLSEPLSSREDRHALFAVNESSAVRVRLYRLASDAEPSLDAWIGRSGAEYDTFFLRRSGSAEVFEARGMGRFEFEKDAGEWAERVVAALDASSVFALELRGQKHSLRLSRSAGRWVLEGGKPVSAAGLGKIDAVLTALSRLEGDSVSAESSLDPLLLRGVNNPELRLSARYGLGQSLTLDIGPKAPEFVHWVRRKGKEGFLYKFSGWKLESLHLTAKDL